MQEVISLLFILEPRLVTTMTDYNNLFLLKFAATIDARLINYRHYAPWCDVHIAEEPDPPLRMLELSTTKYSPAAVRLLHQAAYDTPQERWLPATCQDFWICCQFLRYERREISWATFLSESGCFSDANGASWECEQFFHLLDQYELSDFSVTIEQQQTPLFRDAFSATIHDTHAFYKPFRELAHIQHGEDI